MDRNAVQSAACSLRRNRSASAPATAAVAVLRVTTIRSARPKASQRSRQGPAGSGQGDPAALSALITTTFRSRATPSSWYASSRINTWAP